MPIQNTSTYLVPLLVMGVPAQLYLIFLFYLGLISRRHYSTSGHSLDTRRYKQRIIITWITLTLGISSMIILAMGRQLPAFKRYQDLAEHKSELITSGTTSSYANNEFLDICALRYEENRCGTELRPKLDKKCFALVSAMTRPLYDVWLIAFCQATVGLLTAFWCALPQVSLIISALLLSKRKYVVDDLLRISQ
jgi:hypothetical protein